jgi:uncharacterized protein (TIRG00374 family)
MTVFIALLYGIYMLALLFAGLGLSTGLIPGGGSPAITLVPAIFAAVVITLALALVLLPRQLERRTRAARAGTGRLSRWTARAVTLSAAVASGVRGALALVRRGDPGLLGAVGWWGFDIAVLWACFQAFGTPPPVAFELMGYFLGMAANTLPVPGGVGSVEGGMIGALFAFGVDAGLAIVAVLSYRALAFWLPTIPGAFAYIGLRRTVKRWQSSAEAKRT